MIRLLAYIGLWLFAMFSIAFSVALGVLTALKTFWKQELEKGEKITLELASGIVLANNHIAEKKKKDKKNERA